MGEQTPWWQSTQFDFFKMPKALFRNPYYSALSPESKLLYGFLLDRSCLSWENGEQWRNEQGDPFVICTLKEIQERLHCAVGKAARMLKDLEDHHLIHRTRPKRDGPYHIVVKPFPMEYAKSNVPTIENRNSPVSKTDTREYRKSILNKTDNNKTESNNTHLITGRGAAEWEIKKNIYYDILILDYPKEQVDSIVEVMVDILTTPMKTITIGGIPRDMETVRSRVLQADDMRIRYVFDRMQQAKNPIESYPAYCLARLYEPEGTVDAFYTAWVAASGR